MKKMIAASVVGLMLSVTGPVLAAQQSKMKGCNQEAKEMGIKGDERKAFMKKCLSKEYQLKSGKTVESSAASTADQNRLKACKSEASQKGLKGDARKSFMTDCTKG
jgi:hypothetical protein